MYTNIITTYYNMYTWKRMCKNKKDYCVRVMVI